MTTTGPIATRLRTAHTADLTPDELRAVRALLVDVFEDDFADEDWDHTLGGVHVLVHDDAGLVAHGAVVQRRVRHLGRFLRTGYVEGVVVRADLQRRGIGGQVMAALERVLDGAYELGALSASYEGEGLYRSRGWLEWPGRIHALGPDGIVHLPEEEGSTFVRASSGTVLDPAHELLFDWRDGDVL
jgi:aminoglycoside 2'-N-acetyltransferase I